MTQTSSVSVTPVTDKEAIIEATDLKVTAQHNSNPVHEAGHTS